MIKPILTLSGALFLLTGCGWFGNDNKPKRAWSKDHATSAQTRAQIKTCQQYLDGVLPNKHKVVMAKCMGANGYRLKRVRVKDKWW